MPVASDVLEVKHFHHYRAQAAIVVCHWRVDSLTGAGATDAEVAADLDTAWDGVVVPCMVNAATYDGVKVQKIWPLPVSLGVELANADNGTGGADPLPTQTCGVITKQTPIAGRKFRGRAYIPFPPTAFLDTDNNPTVAYVTALGPIGGFLTSTRTIVGVGGTTFLSPVIYHRATHTVDVVTTSRQNRKWGTQRRRGEYGRPNPTFP